VLFTSGLEYNVLGCPKSNVQQIQSSKFKVEVTLRKSNPNLKP